jgi:hypothetical protein
MDRPVFPEKYEKFWRLFNPDPEFDNRKRANAERYHLRIIADPRNPVE